MNNCILALLLFYTQLGISFQHSASSRNKASGINSVNHHNYKKLANGAVCWSQDNNQQWRNFIVKVSRDLSNGKPKARKHILAGKRIIDGQRASKGQWPWQILLLKRDKPKCGASILSPYWVITAAHCVIDRNTKTTYLPSYFTVRAGEYDTEVIEDTEQEIGITEIITHPEFELTTYHSDVALIKPYSITKSTCKSWRPMFCNRLGKNNKYCRMHAQHVTAS